MNTRIQKTDAKKPLLPKKRMYEITIPVKDIDVEQFLKKDATHSAWEKPSVKITTFINGVLPTFGIMDKDGFFEDIMGEIVRNSFDAYVMAGLHKGQALALKVVIQQKDNSVIVKIKDNGCGFKDKAKSTYFSRAEISSVSVTKNRMSLYGGANLGLSSIVNKAEKMTATVTFKNRKDQGSTIYFSFDTPENIPSNIEQWKCCTIL